MTNAKAPPGVSIGQSLHVTCLLALLALAWMAWKDLDERFPVAFWIAISIPIAHQIFVWLAWRLELRSASTSKSIGFRGYTATLLSVIWRPIRFSGRIGLVGLR